MKMKNSSKKWWIILSAFALCLPLLTLSFSPVREITGTFEFASSELSLAERTTGVREVPIETEEGEEVVATVQRIRGDSSKVVVTIPSITEGKVCYNCDKNNLFVEGKFSSDLSDLQDTIEQAVRDQDKKVSKKDKNEEKVAAKEDDNEDEEDDENPILARILEKCEDDEDDDQLSCLKDGLLDAMKKNSSKKKNDKLSAKEAHAFYKEYIEKELIRKIYKSQKSSRSDYRTTMFGLDYDDSYDEYTDPNSAIEEAVEFVEEFLTETPSRFTRIRDSLFDAQEKIMKIEANNVKQLNQMAKGAKGTQEGLMFSREALSRTQQMQDLWGTLGQVNKYSLFEALQADNITSGQHASYLNNLYNLNNRMTDLITNPMSAAYTSDISYMVEMENRLVGNLRNGGLVTVPGGMTSTRTTNFQTLPGGVVPGTTALPGSAILPGQTFVPNAIQQRINSNRGF